MHSAKLTQLEQLPTGILSTYQFTELVSTMKTIYSVTCIHFEGCSNSVHVVFVLSHDTLIVHIVNP